MTASVSVSTLPTDGVIFLLMDYDYVFAGDTCGGHTLSLICATREVVKQQSALRVWESSFHQGQNGPDNLGLMSCSMP